jgi:xanthine dehydrogenase accessory factor
MSDPSADWLSAALECLGRGKACTLVTVAATQGSVPREAGTKMLVHLDGIAGSVGGGHLEFKAVAEARSLLQTFAAPGAELVDFALGPSLGQCCGGRVTLLFETLTAGALPWLQTWHQAPGDQAPGERVLLTRLSPLTKIVLEPGEPAFEIGADLEAALAMLAGSETPAVLFGHGGDGPCYLLERMVDSRQDLYLFGAGHVASALVRILALLPYRVRWIDARTDMFPGVLPPNVETDCSGSPRYEVKDAPRGCFYLVMTHSHATDLEICDRILARGDFGYLGLIGSDTKRTSFLRRLRARGHGEALLNRLVCPIGLPQITGKEPASIAVAVAGDLLARSEAVARDRLAPSSAASRASFPQVNTGS